MSDPNRSIDVRMMGITKPPRRPTSPLHPLHISHTPAINDTHTHATYVSSGAGEELPVTQRADSGPDRYTYAEQRSFLFALWKKLGSIRMLCLCCTIGVPS